MRFQKGYTPSLAGSLLIAHPAMVDPHFSQSVILISAHSSEAGGMGVVVNYPLNQTMGDFDHRFDSTPLASVPVYVGGPIHTESMILAAWEWSEQESVFKFHFGISEDDAVHLMNTVPGVEVRAFLGHSEWGQGQLEIEIKKHAWFLSSVKNLRLSNRISVLWHRILEKIKPELLFLVDPDDPSLN